MKLTSIIAALLLLCMALPGARGAKKPKPTSCTGKDKETYPIGQGYLDTKTCIQYTCVKKKGKLRMVGKKRPKPCTGPPSTPAIPQEFTTIPPPPGPESEALERKIEALQGNITNIIQMITDVQSTSNKQYMANMEAINDNKEAIASNREDISIHEDSIAANKGEISAIKEDLSTHGEAISRNEYTCSAVKISTQNLGTCLADINSPDCPNSGRGKLAMTAAIKEAQGSCCEVTPGGWSDWSEFSDCSATCGSATKMRDRTCTNPPPANGGAQCPGSNQETVDCALSDCGGYTTTVLPPPCPSGWISLTTGCYKLISFGTHKQVTSNCENEGGFLIEVNNQEEQDAVFQFVQDEGLSSHFIWLGATDITTEGEWIWTHSGNKMTFTAWLPGSPTNVTGFNCLEAVGNNNFKWNDFTCTSSGNLGLCERGGDVTTTVSPPPPLPPPCPEGWTSLTTGCYKFIASGNHQEVTTNCENEGGFLIEIDNQEEQDAAFQFVQDEDMSSKYIWLGATDITTEGEWIWTHSGNKMTFTAWLPGSPTNGTGHNCLEANGKTFKWNDFTCSAFGYGFCEIATVTPPTPTLTPTPTIDDVVLLPCPEGWTYLATGCYKFIASGNHEQVTTNCENEGGFLVEINNQEEQDAVLQFYKNDGITDYFVWLGATDVTKEGEWIWSHSGNKMTFTAWNTNEPSNKNSQNCLEAHGNDNFKWGDWTCIGIGRGLCEQPAKLDNCGIEKGKRIIGGNETVENQYPWMVRLPMGCGGSLITDRHILTARHCLCWRGHHSNNHDDCKYSNTCPCTSNHKWAPTMVEGSNYWRGEMVKVSVHNQYDATDYREIPIKEVKWPKGDDHDFAMIILDRAVDLTDDTIGTVCLPYDPNEEYAGKKVIAMGWGDTIDTASGQSPVLNHVWLTVSYGHSNYWLFTDIGNVNNEHQSFCHGDSGGPLVYKNVQTGRWTIIGTARGYYGWSCLNATVNIWNKVTGHSDWIKKTVQNTG